MATIATDPRLQQRDALAKANHVRTTNAGAFKDLKAKPRHEALQAVADLLRHGDMEGPAGSMQVYRTLTAIRHVDEVKASRLLVAAQVFDPARSLRRLSVRQRHRLAEALEVAAAEVRRR